MIESKHVLKARLSTFIIEIEKKSPPTEYVIFKPIEKFVESRKYQNSLEDYNEEIKFYDCISTDELIKISLTPSRSQNIHFCVNKEKKEILKKEYEKISIEYDLDDVIIKKKIISIL